MISRVLMTSDTVGGVWSYTLELARALGRYGVQVHVATMGPPPTDAQREEVEALSTVTLHVSAWRLEWMPHPWTDVARAGRWLLALERRIRPDIIHLNGYVHAALPWAAPVLVVAHSCVLSWHLAVKHCQAPGVWNTYRTRVATGLHAADMVIAPTQAMLNAICTHYGEPERSLVVANGRDARDYPTAHKEPLILSVGRVWDEAKNIPSVAGIAPSLPWPTVLIGDTCHPVTSHEERGTLTCGAHWLGRLAQHDVAHWMARASICALPVRYEPFGLAALEAALAGCALVLGDVPSLREVWGDAASYVPPDDPEALRAALLALTGDAVLRRARADAAHARALEYSVDRMLRGYLTAYAGMIARRMVAEFACAS